MRFITQNQDPHAIILKVGMKFVHNEDTYIVANCGFIPDEFTEPQTDSPLMLTLINMHDGNRWCEMRSMEKLSEFLTDNPDFTLLR